MGGCSRGTETSETELDEGVRGRQSGMGKSWRLRGAGHFQDLEKSQHDQRVKTWALLRGPSFSSEARQY